MSNIDIDPTNRDSCVSFIQLILYYIVNLVKIKVFFIDRHTANKIKIYMKLTQI